MVSYKNIIMQKRLLIYPTTPLSPLTPCGLDYKENLSTVITSLVSSHDYKNCLVHLSGLVRPTRDKEFEIDIYYMSITSSFEASSIFVS